MTERERREARRLREQESSANLRMMAAVLEVVAGALDSSRTKHEAARKITTAADLLRECSTP